MKRISLALLLGSALLLLAPLLPAAATAAPLKTWLVQADGTAAATSHDGVVEALRQTVVAAQVAGAIQQIEVKVGDRVKAGQVLMRIDARAANQAAEVSEAQAQAARAQGQLAAREFERQQQLFKQNYISRAALEQAEAQHKASQAQVQAQLAQWSQARTQSGFNIVRSPYAGVLAELPVALGDMALPGRPLASVYDPAALRVSAHLPQTLAAALMHSPAGVQVEIPDLGATTPRLATGRVQIMPTGDAASHTQELRIDLVAPPSGVVPGMFARVWLPTSMGNSAGKLRVPRAAIVQRAELSAVYVLDPKGRPLLRLVRLGAQRGEMVEVLSGLVSGERVALEPLMAALPR
jgi:multidrug efflux system membrane fusion protein